MMEFDVGANLPLRHIQRYRRRTQCLVDLLRCEVVETYFQSNNTSV